VVGTVPTRRCQAPPISRSIRESTPASLSPLDNRGLHSQVDRVSQDARVAPVSRLPLVERTVQRRGVRSARVSRSIPPSRELPNPELPNPELPNPELPNPELPSPGPFRRELASRDVPDRRRVPPRLAARNGPISATAPDNPAEVSGPCRPVHSGPTGQTAPNDRNDLS